MTYRSLFVRIDDKVRRTFDRNMDRVLSRLLMKERERENGRVGGRDREVVVRTDDEVALLLSLNTTRGS